MGSQVHEHVSKRFS
jgi:hypothetical protein